jgi:hypothetical protein
MEILKIEMECPSCHVTAKLPIRSINRVVECPVCRAEIMGVAGEGVMIVKPPPDLRFIEVICAVSKKSYPVVFERKAPGELYRVVKDYKAPALLGGSANTPVEAKQTFNYAEFDRSGWACEGCGCTNWAQSTNCCQVLYCYALHVKTEKGNRGCCPKCGKEEYYTQTATSLSGTDNKPLFLATAPMETGIVRYQYKGPTIVHEHWVFPKLSGGQ